MNSKWTLLILGLIMGHHASFSQELDQKLQVIKAFDSDLYASEPLFTFDELREESRLPLDDTGDSLVRLKNTIPDLDLRIKPMAYQMKKPESLFHGYLSAHHGNYNPLAVSGSYTYHMDNYFLVQVDGLHDIWEEDEVRSKKIGRSKGHVGFKYYLDRHNVSRLDLSGSKKMYGIYGFSDSVTEDLADRRYTSFGVDWGLQSFRVEQNSVNYDLRLSYHRMHINDLSSAENEFRIDGKVDFGIGPFTSVWLSGRHWQTLLPTMEIMKLEAQSAGAGIRLNTRALSGSVGINHLFSDGNRYWFPEVDLRAEFGTIAVAFELNQEATLEGLRELEARNPYLGLVDGMYGNTYRRGGSLSLSSISTYFDQLALTLHMQEERNAVNFTIDPLQTGLFEANRVDLHIYALSFSAVRSWLDVFSSDLDVAYFRYDHNSTELFHRPDLSVKPGIGLHLFNKRFDVNLKGVFLIGMTIQDQAGMPVMQAFRKDLSGSLRFAVTRRINVYFDVDNILNDDFQIWSGYEVFGRNISGGALIKF